MKTYLFINYFRDANEERRAEYLHCVNKNLSLDFIEKIYVFLDVEEHKTDLPESDKFKFIVMKRHRLEFADAIRVASTELEKDSIVIICNLDIYLDDSDAWRNIDRDFFQVGHPKKAMVCCRYNLNEDGTSFTEMVSWMNGEFCDAWIFKTPIDPLFIQEDLEFCVGNAPQCDNVMMHLMSNHYHVYSWGEKYKIFHYDVCRKKLAYKMVLSDTTDYRASLRKPEQSHISAFQKWEQLLKTGTAPSVALSCPSYKKVAK